MFTVHVFFQVKPGQVESFREATLENVRSSIKETGIIRFDLLQQQDDPSKFVLSESYHTPADQSRHREAGHYKKWRSAVEGMLSGAYTFTRYDNLFPDGAE